jgi:ribosomal protein S18 acetylase RimI-like enzyme
MKRSQDISVAWRSAHPEDEEFLSALYTSTRAEEVAAWGWTAAQEEAFLRMQFQAQRQAYQWQFPGADHQIILRQGQPVGRCLVYRTEAEIRLVDLALLPEDRGAGLGSAVVQALLDEAQQAGKPVRLHVTPTNRAARWYARLGFKPIGETPTHLSMEWSPVA